MRLLAASLTLISFAAFAGESAAPADQAAKPAAAAAPAPVAAASVPSPERKRVCTRETSVGSHIAHTVCRDEGTEADKAATAQELDNLRNSVNRIPPAQQSSH